MRLVPRQLQIHGLTGDVPYFGGRLTPAQAYAASRPRPSAPGAAPGSVPQGGMAQVGGPRGVVPPGAPASGELGPIPGIPSSVPQAAPLSVPSTMQPTQAPSVLAPATAQPTSATGQAPNPAAAPGSAGGAPPTPGGAARPESQRAIQQLLLAGIITTSEADQLAGRLTS